MLPERMRFFYGWVILILAWVCYGLGMSPLYYSWGNFAAAIIEDLGLDRGWQGSCSTRPAPTLFRFSS